jgi:hypothetical protein
MPKPAAIRTMLLDIANAPTTPSKENEASRTSRYENKKNPALPVARFQGSAISPRRVDSVLFGLTREQVSEAVHRQVGDQPSQSRKQNRGLMVANPHGYSYEDDKCNQHRSAVHRAGPRQRLFDVFQPMIVSRVKQEIQADHDQKDAAECCDGRVRSVQSLLVLDRVIDCLGTLLKFGRSRQPTLAEAVALFPHNHR